MSERGSPTLSDEQKAKYKEAFGRLDHDGSGTLNANDVELLLQRLGVEVTRAEVLEYIAEVDANGDGQLDFPEFLDMLTLHRNSVLAGVIDQLILSDAQVRELEDVFNLFDKNRDGSISASELEAVLRDLGQDVEPDELAEMIAEVDDDNDGVIDFDEFCIMMSRRMKDSDLEADVRAVFSLFDPEEAGAADADAVVAVFASVGEEISRTDALKLIRAADLDHDGLLTVEDLLDVMNVRKGLSGHDLNSSSGLNLSGLLASPSSLLGLGR